MMFTDNKNFYPTPEHIIKKMLEPYYSKYNTDFLCLSDKTILEPSAGKGDIIDFIKEAYSHFDPQNVFCIESDVNLQAILKDKNYRLLGTDFLSFTTDRMINLIIMNPPFDEGDKHLLKAWDVIFAEGEIVCLLNQETINNAYSNDRKRLQAIISEYGTTEELGRCFDTAERKTAVEVVLVRLKKPSIQKFDYCFTENVTNEETYISNDSFNLDSNNIVIRDVIGGIIQDYDNVKKSLGTAIKAMQEFNYYFKRIDTSEYQSKDILQKLADDVKSRNNDSFETMFYTAFDKQLPEIKRKVWSNIFDKTEIKNYLSSGVKKQIEKEQSEYSIMDITEDNIKNLLRNLVISRDNMIKETILEVFDKMTDWDIKNKMNIEGWKTNSAYKVNRKFICPPYWIKCDTYDSYSRFSVSYSYGYYDFPTRDLDLIMSLLDGKKLSQIKTISQALETRFENLGKIEKNEKYDNTCESTYFNIKFWKKGTLHVEFKEERLWKEFNRLACLGKNWIGDDTNSKEYNKNERNKK